jgi:NitT/TauT family transport system ATP-binding protein
MTLATEEAKSSQSGTKSGLRACGLEASYLARGPLRLGRRVVFQDISFEVAPGEIVWLRGENGAGKSTLLNALFNPHARVAGKVTVDGAELLPGQFIYLPQAPASSLSPWQKIDAEVALPLRVRGMRKCDWAPRVAALIARTGFKLQLDRGVDQLSGGQRVRVAFLRALSVDKPKCVILDEPFEGLDATGKQTLLLEIRRLADSGLPVILTSHGDDGLKDLRPRVLHLQGQPASLIELSPEMVEPSRPQQLANDDLAPPSKEVVRAEPRRFDPPYFGLLGILGGLLLWHVASIWVGNAGLLPGPLSVATAMRDLVFDDELRPHLIATVERAFGCYAAANLIAIPFGILLGYNTRLFSAMAPWLTFGRALPVFALVGPVIGLLAGKPELQRLVIIAASLFLISLQAVSSAAALAPRRRVQCARAFGATHWFCLRRIMPFESISGIFGALEISLPIAIIVTLVVETFLIPDVGLGLYILNHMTDADLSQLFAHIAWPALLATIGLLVIRRMSARYRHEV